MCMVCRDLNKASSKDNFPLSHMDGLVDNTTNRALFLLWMGIPVIPKLGWL